MFAGCSAWLWFATAAHDPCIYASSHCRLAAWHHAILNCRQARPGPCPCCPPWAIAPVATELRVINQRMSRHAYHSTCGGVKGPMSAAGVLLCRNVQQWQGSKRGVVMAYIVCLLHCLSQDRYAPARAQTIKVLWMDGGNITRGLDEA